MKPDPAQKFAECVALCRSSEPLTEQDRAILASAVAKVRAEDERRRQPSPQLELREAA